MASLAALVCVDMGGLVYMRESWGPVGAGLNGRRWAFEEEKEGCRVGEQLIGSPVAEEEEEKNTAYGLAA